MKQSRLIVPLTWIAFSILAVTPASAQYWRQDDIGFIQPRWRNGSAVCPEGYDYDRGRCKPQGQYGRGRGGNYGDRGGYYGERRRARDGVPPRFNRRGSAVCPEGYDYYDNAGLCFSR